MTLRVEVSIIPFGREDDRTVIKTLNISNMGKLYDNVYDYVIEVDEYKAMRPDVVKVSHDRADGAETLIKKSLEALGF